MDDQSETGSPRTLKTVARAIDIIQALEELGGAGITELADTLGLSKSSTYNYLGTLQENRLVVRDGDTYRLSYQFLHIGRSVRDRATIYQHGREELARLAHDTGRYVHLATEEHGLAVDLYKVKGEEAIGSRYQLSKLQRPDYLHFSATGKAILAHLPESRVDWIVDEYGLTRRTANTITDRAALAEELERTRERGYSINREEEIEGIRAVGAPILGQDDDVLGSISVSGPAHRMQDDGYRAELVDAVTDTANVIEVNINTADADVDGFPDFRG
ncbi:IclR family transcriptional regulator [Halomicrococcus gelatinilyticus]|uniref:IclR family transcriptional regulator n=1 Tax=Halomicrococcus gelatinilyticus TaxID=1702103 RepID=UPI002E125E91